MPGRWIARVVRSDDEGRRFNYVGYREEDPGSAFMYVRDASGTWKDEANGEVADRPLAETFEYLCARADERRVDQLSGVYEEDGPSVLDL